jgi:hypothetical protein
MALIKLSFAHGAQKEDGRRRTDEELANLPPNMRRPMVCSRERLPVAVELLIDGAPLYQAVLPPTGLAGDGPSRTYQRFAVAPGRHELSARLRDTDRAEGFDFERTAVVELAPAQSLAIDFRAEMGGFRIPVNAEATSWPSLSGEKEFETGIAEVDHEHQELVEQINQLHAQLGGDTTKETVSRFLGEVFARISAHFALEETVMRKHRYDGY